MPRFQGVISVPTYPYCRGVSLCTHLSGARGGLVGLLTREVTDRIAVGLRW